MLPRARRALLLSGRSTGPPALTLDSAFGGVFPVANTPDFTGLADTAKYVMGTHFRPLVGRTVVGIDWFVPTNVLPANADFGCGLLQVDPVTGITGVTSWLNWTAQSLPLAAEQGTWKRLLFSSPVNVPAGTELYACVRTDRYAFSAHVFDADRTSLDSTVVLQANNGPYPNGAFVQGSDTIPTPPVFSAGSFNATFYGIDPVWEA